MGQLQTQPRGCNQTARVYPPMRIKTEQFYNKRIEHQGILKLREVPFKNCIQIQTEQTSLFMENIQITLKDLLQSRLYTNKLFPKEDIEKLIQNVTYTLAYLQQNQVPYKDVSSQNIFYDEGVFKILPNQLILESRYKKFVNRYKKISSSSAQMSLNDKQFVTLSPQMIIAFRCKQTQITDFDILDKSNVFYLGLLLLQVSTLLPSYECYDTQTSDILDEVITERIQLVREYYSEQIASIVANMLDYDYAQRMTLKQVSIFVNRELNKDVTQNSKISKDLSNKKPNRTEELTLTEQNVQQNQSRVNHSHSKTVSICKSRIENTDQTQSCISKPSQIGDTSSKKKNKTNKIYMNESQPQNQQDSTFTKQDRNKVYMKSSTNQHKRTSYVANESLLPQRSSTALRQISNNVQNSNALCYPRQASGKLFNVKNVQQKFPPTIPDYVNKKYDQRRHINVNNEEDEQNRYVDAQFAKKGMLRKNSTDYLGYRAHAAKNTQKEKQNEKYHKQSKFQRENDEYNHPQSNKFNNGQIRRQAADFGYSRKDQSFGQRYADRSSFDEDSGSRGYFDAEKMMGNNNLKASNNQQFKDHDHSLNRIKSQIQRSRKLIQEFKRGQKSQF